MSASARKAHPAACVIGALFLCAPPASAFAQVVHPTADQDAALKALEGAYLSNNGNVVLVTRPQPGVVSVQPAGGQPGVLEAATLQLHANGTLEGNFNLRQSDPAVERLGPAFMEWSTSPKAIYGWLQDRRHNSERLPWTLCARAGAQLQPIGGGLWADFSAANYGSGQVEVALDLLLAGPAQSLTAERLSLQLEDGGRRVTTKGFYDPARRQTAATLFAERCAPTKVHFRFDAPPPATGAQRKFVLVLDGKDVATWDAQAGSPLEAPDPIEQTPTPPAPDPIEQGGGGSPPPSSPAPAPSSPGGERPTAGFKTVGKWAVRVDRVDTPREDRLVHVYMTFRNASKGVLFQTQGVLVRMEDSEGVATQNGQSLRAVEGYPQQFPSPPAVDPGRELKVKFVFDLAEGASPQQITVIEDGRQVTFEAFGPR